LFGLAPKQTRTGRRQYVTYGWFLKRR